jgi:2-desacetyl-2-hydroxyethyl bacteriochlorophyllide A dehydrogenase
MVNSVTDDNKSMKAAIFTEDGRIELISKPIPVLSNQEALIEVRYAGICGSDVSVWKKKHPTATYPRVPGHEFVGILREIKGNSPRNLRPGALVAVQPFFSCGVCEACTQGKSNVCYQLKIMGIHMDGCFAEYVAVPLDKVYPLPAQTDPKTAALIEPLAVALHDIRESGLHPGERVVIIGGGPIGVLLAILARKAGAGQVSVLEIDPSRIQSLREMGFEAFDPGAGAVQAHVRDVTRGLGFDVVFEASGSRQGLATMTEVAKVGARVVVVGMAPQPCPVNTTSMFFKELKLLGVRLHSPRAFSDAADLVVAGRLDQELDMLIDRIFPLDEVAAAMAYQVEDTKHFKTLIKIR